MPLSPRSRLQIRRRLSPLHDVLPSLRALTTTLLIVALLIGGIRWLAQSKSAGALEFTPRIIGVATGAVGVQGIATHDVDADGDVDVVTAGLDGIKIYENKGKLSFTVKIVDEADAERVVVRDINGDGSPDLLVTLKSASPSVRWYRNDGELEFEGMSIGATGADAVAALGDLNSDGSPDVVTAGTESGTVTLRRWMNNGSGGFTATTLKTDSGVTSVAIADLDNNGYPDIIVGGSGGLLRWTTTNGTTFTQTDIDDDKQNRTHIAVADSGDHTYIVTGDVADNVVAVYRGSAEETYTRTELSDGADAKTVAPVDLDGDGDLDIVVAAQDEFVVFWYENIGGDEWTQHTLAAGVDDVYGVAVADLDKDGDLDVVTGDFLAGNVIVYERVRVKPTATSPTNILQSTGGTGKISFETTIADGDLDPTRVRIQYSLDGTTWEKPWLTSVKASAGAVDLKNSNGYQVGTTNPIDTATNSNVTLTLIWDTKSIQNTGGPVTGDPNNVQLRIIPRDNRHIGDAAVTAKFTVDNKVPQGLTSLAVTDINTDSITVTWPKASDRSHLEYEVYYGTDQAAVLEQRSSVWDGEHDEGLLDTEATSTTITGLTKDTTYTFKLVAVDDFGNTSAAPSARATTLATDSPADSPTPTGAATPAPDVTPTPTASPTSLPTSLPPTPPASPTSDVPSVLENNQAPLADAGPNLVVNPSALVVLDGTASADRDQRVISYSWRQLAGPQVEMLSATTATPSFAAGGENETYIFLLTIRDTHGAIATDTVTVATKALPETDQTPVIINTSPLASPPAAVPSPSVSPLVRALLHPIDLILFALAVISTLLLLFERILHAIKQGQSARQAVTGVSSQVATPQGKVVHYKTGEPIAGAQVLIYGSDGKLRATERTNNQGFFPTFFPAGQYTLGVQAQGFAFAATGARALASEGGILYSGGNLVVRDPNKPLAIVIPMKPVAGEVSSQRARLLHLWQFLQHLGRVLSWPIFLLGALLNTVLVFMVPRPLYLIIEVAYIALVILKIALEVRVRPAYGQVRDAITHVPLDLAVVRLFEQGTNRVVMTRVTNNQGKFFALPPAGSYTVTISKPGYGMFSKENVEIKSEHDTTLQVTADLMPVAPHATGLQQARAAVL